MREKSEEQYLGHFKIGTRRLPGHVTLKGRESRLEVYSGKFIFLDKEKMRTIHGTSRTGEKITICDAVGAKTSGRHGSKHFLSLFPNFVAIGPRFLNAEVQELTKISYTTSGAVGLFYDLHAFGSADNKKIEKLLPKRAKKDSRPIQFSELFYYVSRGDIICVDADNVKVRACNAVSFSFPSPVGIHLDNEIRIEIAFKNPVALEDTLRAVYDLNAFCEIVSQTKQCIQDIAVRHKKSTRLEMPVRLYVSNAETEKGGVTEFTDNLVSAGLNREEFEKVLHCWLKTNDIVGPARRRIVQGFREGNRYTIDRLVGAANAFDLLPKILVGDRKIPKTVTDSLSKLNEQAKMLRSPYREQVLSNLNLVKGLNLRTKIEKQFQSLPRSLRLRFPHMSKVIGHCVKARNYFVHGSDPALTIDETYRNVSFFTDTLEFIFIAATLSKCGWKANRWLKQAHMGSLRYYVFGYDYHLKELADLPNSGIK